MRNLKRVLSLALALVMVLGMMVIGTSAATFTDAEEITYTEAVDVMSALGVINGYPAADGTFYFDGDKLLTRAEGAALVCYMLMGKPAADLLVGSGNFSDVPADHWAAGEIDYCYNLGFINGNGDGTFNPGGPLTSIAFGRMLLGALGYNGAIEGYAGENWATNIGSDLIDIGLDVRGVAMDAQLTREQAAQMALQSLTKTLVKYTNPGTEIVLSDGTKVIVGASPASSKTWGDFPGRTPVDYTSSADFTSVQFCERYFSTLGQTGGTVNGRSGFYWTVKTDKVSDFVITDVVLKTVYGDTTTLAQMTTKGSPYFIGLELDTDVFGTPAGIDYYKNGASGASTDIEVAGAVAELIDTDYDGLVNKVCVVEKTVTTLTADPSISTVKEQDYVTIAACGVASKSVDEVIGYEGLKKGDVVLYVHMDDGSVVIEKAESFNGFVLGSKVSYGTTYDLIGDEYYTDTGLTVAGLNNYTEGTILDPTVEYTFYLDNAGFIVKAVPVSAAAIANYAVVRDIAWVVNNTNGAIGTRNTSYAEAKLVFADGTYEVVEIASIDGYKLIAAGTRLSTLVAGSTYYANNTSMSFVDGYTGACGAVSTNTATAENYYAIYDGNNAGTATLKGKFLAIENAIVNGKADLVAAIPVDTFYTYTVNADGTYNLSTTMKRGETVAALNSGDTIDNGKVQFNGTNVADDNTVFIYVTVNPKTKQDVYTVYTGIDNVPTTSANVTGNFVKKTGTGVATLVFANVAGTQDDSRDIVYITSSSYTTINGKTPYYIYNAIVNGVVTTVKADYAGLGVDFYKVDKVVDGVYTLNNTIANTADKVGVQSISGGILVTGDETAYAYAAGAPAYIIEKVGVKFVCTPTVIDALTVDATDALFVQTKSVAGNTVAETVYVVKADEDVTALVIAAGGSNAATVTQGDFFHATLPVAVTGSGKNVKINTITAQTDTTIKGVSINGVDAGNATDGWVDCALKATAGVNTIVVTIEDDFSGALSAYTYTFTVANPI